MNGKILLFLLLLLQPAATFAQSRSALLSSYNFLRGEELLKGNEADSAEAMNYLQKEVDEHPKNGYAYYYMAKILSDKGKSDKAFDCVDRAIKLIGKDKAWISFAYRLRAELYLTAGDSLKCLADWQESLKQNPKDVLTLADRADYYYNNDQYDLADADYDALIAINPAATEGYLGRAYDALACEQYASVVRWINHCIELKPDSADFYGIRATAYLGLKKYNEAADDVIKAVSLDRKCKAMSLVYHFDTASEPIMMAKLRIQQAKDGTECMWALLLGSMYEANGQYEKALKAYQESCDAKETDFALRHQGSCLIQLGQYNRALYELAQSATIDSLNYEYYQLKAICLYELGRKAEALGVINYLIELEPNKSYGYTERARMRYISNDYAEAADDYTTAMVLDGKSAYNLVQRASCYRAEGMNAEAEADLRQALKLSYVTVDSATVCGLPAATASRDSILGPDKVDYSNGSLAQYAYLGLGYRDWARVVADSLLALNHDAWQYYGAACLYSLLGEADKAMGYLRKSLELGYGQLTYLMDDKDLDSLKNRADFKALLREYKAKMAADSLPAGTASEPKKADRKTGIVEIPFSRSPSGMMKVKCKINGLQLDFLFDTGSTVIAISPIEADFMLRNGYLSKSDIKGKTNFFDSNGDSNSSSRVILRHVSFGGIELTDVVGSISDSRNAPLMLGQSLLTRFGSVEIDYERNVLRVKYYK